jgi:hypothetical protein
MAAARITTVAGEIATLIGGMTTAGGYHFTWGTINEHDAAHSRSYPCALIRYKTEGAVDGIAGIFGMQNAEFTITVDYKITPTLTVQPEITADASLDSALADLLRLFSINNTGYLPLSGEAFFSFKSSEKLSNPQGNTYRPVQLVTKWNLYYHNS